MLLKTFYRVLLSFPKDPDDIFSVTEHSFYVKSVNEGKVYAKKYPKSKYKIQKIEAYISKDGKIKEKVTTVAQGRTNAQSSVVKKLNTGKYKLSKKGVKKIKKKY